MRGPEPGAPGIAHGPALERMLESVARHAEVDARTLAAMRQVPRHLFLPPRLARRAYDDHPLDIGHEQTISAPHMVGIMVSILDVRPGHNVLDVGTGSGYHAAVLAKLAGPTGSVVSVERVPELAEAARRALGSVGCARVEVRVGDGVVAAADRAPFDRISVAAAAPFVPPPLLDQLAPGGRLVLPVGIPDTILVAYERQVNPPTEIRSQRHGACRFVPLVTTDGPAVQP